LSYAEISRISTMEVFSGHGNTPRAQQQNEVEIA